MPIRLQVLVCGCALAGLIAAAVSMATLRLSAQAEPLRVYDIGRLCLYAIDTGGLWGVSKDALGVDVTGACPNRRR